MKCQDCGKWLLERKTTYLDGTEIMRWQAPPGKGHCNALGIETPPDFGCTKFQAGDHIAIEHKPDVPWHYWTMISCPVCSGVNPNGTKCQCAGTGKVRLYDDGFVGSERDRKHPKDNLPPPTPDAGTVLQPVEKPDVITHE